MNTSSYKVKLFVPKHKKPITRHLHQYKQKFSSVEDMKIAILKELCNEFPRAAAAVDVAASPLKFGLYLKKTYNTCILQSASKVK